MTFWYTYVFTKFIHIACMWTKTKKYIIDTTKGFRNVLSKYIVGTWIVSTGEGANYAKHILILNFEKPCPYQDILHSGVPIPLLICTSRSK